MTYHPEQIRRALDSKRGRKGRAECRSAVHRDEVLMRWKRWAYNPWTVCRAAGLLYLIAWALVGWVSPGWSLIPLGIAGGLTRHAARTWWITKRLLAEANRQLADRRG